MAGTAHYDRLSPIGQSQAGVLRNFIASTGKHDGDVWSGSLKRQKQTARIAHELGDDHHVFPRLHEGLNEYDHKAVHRRYDPRELASRDPDVVEHDVALDMTLPVYSNIIQTWIADTDALNDPEFESWAEFSNRTLGAISDIASHSTKDTVFVYSSGGAISAIIAQLDGLTPADTADIIWQMKNTSITTLKTQNEKLSVVHRNNVDHLHSHDPELITAI